MPIRSDFKSERDWLEHLHIWFAGQALNGMLAAGQTFSNTTNMNEWSRLAFVLGSEMIGKIPSSAIPSESGIHDEEEEGGD
jgi:hypothetical protein